jgi:hypothetical protein
MSTNVDPFTLPSYDEITTADKAAPVRCKPEVFPIDGPAGHDRMRLVLVGKVFTTTSTGEPWFFPKIVLEVCTGCDSLGVEQWKQTEPLDGTSGRIVRELVMTIRRLTAQHTKATVPFELANFAGLRPRGDEIVHVGPFVIGTVPEQPLPFGTVLCGSAGNEVANHVTDVVLNNGKRGEVDHD